MSRRFPATGGPHRIHLEAGSAGSWTARGAYTFAILWKPATAHNGGLFTAWTLADDNRLPVNNFGDGHVYFTRSGFASDGALSGGYDSFLNLWQVWIISVAGGSATPRIHRYVINTDPDDRAWEHVDGDHSIGDLSDTLSTLWIGMLDDSQYGDHSIACAGISRVHLDDAAVEAAGLEHNFPAWIAALNPTTGDGVAWALNQTSTATAVVDATGSGADQVHLDGTSVDLDDPPDFSFDGTLTSAVAATMPALASALAADVDEPGTIAAVMPAVTGALTAEVDLPGVIAATLPRVAAHLAATVVITTAPDLDIQLGAPVSGWTLGNPISGWTLGAPCS